VVDRELIAEQDSVLVLEAWALLVNPME